MNYSTREKIEKFAKDELDLGPFHEKTLRLIDFVDEVIDAETNNSEVSNTLEEIKRHAYQIAEAIDELHEY